MGTVCSSHMEPVLIPPSQRKPSRQGGKKNTEVAAAHSEVPKTITLSATRVTLNSAQRDEDDMRKHSRDSLGLHPSNVRSAPRPSAPLFSPSAPPGNAQASLQAQQPSSEASPAEQHLSSLYPRPPLDSSVRSADLAAQEHLVNVLYSHLSPMPSGSTSCSSGFPRMLVDVRPSASECMTQDLLPSSRCFCDLHTPRGNESQSLASGCGGCPHCRQMDRNHSRPYNPLSQWSATSSPAHHSALPI